MKKLFGKIDMTYKRVILFALIAGIYTALINSVPFLDNTSFQDIAVTYEWWVVFALIVVTNCKKPLEAGIKCFIFFLLSQPIVYLVEILFKEVTFTDALRYYKQMWLPLTVLTLPGGLIAYYSKKDNIFGSIILGIGDAIILIMGVSYIKRCIIAFPYHLLTSLFCIVCSIAIPFFIQDKKKYQILSVIFTYLIAGLVVIYALVNGLSL